MQLKRAVQSRFGDSVWRDARAAIGDTGYAVAVTTHKGEGSGTSQDTELYFLACAGGSIVDLSFLGACACSEHAG